MKKVLNPGIAVLIMAGVFASEAGGAIAWSDAQDISAASDVSTLGTLVEAYNAGGTTSGTDVTVNGVLFTGTGALLPLNTDNDVFSGDTGDASYNALLSAIDYGGGKDVTLALGDGSLVEGNQYQVQVWYVDTASTGRDQYFGDGDADTSNDVQLFGTGQYALGTFVADETGNQNLQIRSGTSNHGNVHITAYQLRDITGAQPQGIITWGPAANVSAASDVLASGELVEALNAGANSVSDQEVNGVLFTGTGALLPSNTENDVFSGDTGDAAYNALLSAVDFGGGASVSLEVGNGQLEAGSEYVVQVWFVDTRYSEGLLRTLRVGDGNGNTVDLDSDPGQYAVGTFTAADTNQVLSLVASNFGNVHLTAYQVRTASSVPMPTLTTATHRVSAPFTVNVDFTEEVTGLQESDFAVTNGSATASSLSGSGNSYSVEITPAANGYVEVSLPAGSVTDTDGDGNPNPASDVLSVLYIAPGSDQPAVTLSTASSNVTATFTVQVNFSEAVSGLEPADFAVENGSVTGLSGTGAAYSVEVIPAGWGHVVISLPEGRVTDLDGDNLWNTASDALVVLYTEPPAVEISGPSASAGPTFKVYLAFTPAVSGFDSNGVDVINGTLLSLTEQGRREFAKRFYIAEIAASTPGTVTVSVPADAAVDAETQTQGNRASTPFAVACSTDFGHRWVVDDQADWESAAASVTGMVISNGLVQPGADAGQFSSRVKTFTARKKARGITFRQSPVWDNWVHATNGVGASGAGDATILLPVGDKDYYFLGRGSTKGYHAWHSSNMVDWVDGGPITAPVHRWVTTAEYKDGLFYIFVDNPNDHTPHLYIDDDLMDGGYTNFKGMVFNDPTHGSDSAVLRDNADGLFHIISEDWTPINARTHAWDSPLATHASSADGITGFVPAEHLPPIDLRTEWTGEYGTYLHPHVDGSPISNPLVYEVHEPEQEAFGDWTSIKVGPQYYLFADYDHTDGSTMSCAVFTSESIYEQYELVGDVKSGGHPDPTVGFAEGQFYLVTQYRDFISPGPWVEGVEARAGVDTNGNSTIDQWTAWQPVSEQYDHMPGYARVVDVEPAEIDLSSLPEGYGFQFEFRVDNTVVTNVSPLMDSVVMDFEPSNFQEWANSNGIPAGHGGDYNTNGIPDVIEFSIGQAVIPERQPDGTLMVTAVNEAIADGLEVQLWFTEDLLSLESWSAATSNTAGVRLLSETVVGGGDHELVFEIFAPNGERVFWRLAVAIP